MASVASTAERDRVAAGGSLGARTERSEQMSSTATEAERHASTGTVDKARLATDDHAGGQR
jgi:hypothetical protein